jgi:hypothetical protein
MLRTQARIQRLNGEIEAMGRREAEQARAAEAAPTPQPPAAVEAPVELASFCGPRHAPGAKEEFEAFRKRLFPNPFRGPAARGS